MDQQQLQIARAALWHQTARETAPLRTFDDASSWLDEIGLCLFLPRHTHLPAPAPSFAEACLGAPSLTPPSATVSLATELASRLVDERRAVPLNLFGAFSEQPDFLITPEVLPWVAAVRGDRQWKSAPAGRTAPLVVRAFEALDRAGELTAGDLRTALGHEISETAAQRALIELWTSLRAMPIYPPDQPTRWTLLKNRYPAQLSTGANTAQATALSALLSIYLRSAVAATPEEAEIFLSPFSARSRIREVLHGMTATRQFGIMTVASQTLLFVEGSLPEAPPSQDHSQVARLAVSSSPPSRKVPRPLRFKPPSQPMPARLRQDRPFERKPPAATGTRPQSSGDRPGKSGSREVKRPSANRPQPGLRTGSAKPWQSRRRDPSRSADPQRKSRPSFEKSPSRSDRFSNRSSAEPRSGPGQRRSRETNRPDNQRNRGRFRGREAPASGRPSEGSGDRRSGNRFPAARSNRSRSTDFQRRGKSSFGNSGLRTNRHPGNAPPFRAKNNFRKPIPNKPNPRKNRSEEENPE